MDKHGNRKKDPAKHVVSFRVTESEREQLLEMSRRYGGNISILLRRCLNLWGGNGRESFHWR